jgi:hypothetical protein
MKKALMHLKYSLLCKHFLIRKLQYDHFHALSYLVVKKENELTRNCHFAINQLHLKWEQSKYSLKYSSLKVN